MVFRKRDGITEVLLVHPGGPFFAKKDTGAWSIPKGEFTNEDPLSAAKREFEEELGIKIDGTFYPMAPIRQKSGKKVYAWAIEADPDLTKFSSNTFTIEWPMKSGKMREFPEIDKAEWFSIEEAKAKLNSGQAGFLDELLKLLQNQ